MSETERIIKENAVRLATIVDNGGSVEIHPSPGGIKIYEVRKATVRQGQERTQGKRNKEGI